jgi:hypothetical protein
MWCCYEPAFADYYSDEDLDNKWIRKRRRSCVNFTSQQTALLNELHGVSSFLAGLYCVFLVLDYVPVGVSLAVASSKSISDWSTCCRWDLTLTLHIPPFRHTTFRHFFICLFANSPICLIAMFRFHHFAIWPFRYPTFSPFNHFCVWPFRHPII